MTIFQKDALPFWIRYLDKYIIFDDLIIFEWVSYLSSKVDEMCSSCAPTHPSVSHYLDDVIDSYHSLVLTGGRHVHELCTSSELRSTFCFLASLRIRTHLYRN